MVIRTVMTFGSSVGLVVVVVVVVVVVQGAGGGVVDVHLTGGVGGMAANVALAGCSFLLEWYVAT